MAGNGSNPTIEEQIAMLNAQMATSAKRLQALEAENAAIRAANKELRTLVDGVVPDSATSKHPVPTTNDERRTTNMTSTDLFREFQTTPSHQK